MSTSLNIWAQLQGLIIHLERKRKWKARRELLWGVSRLLNKFFPEPLDQIETRFDEEYRILQSQATGGNGTLPSHTPRGGGGRKDPVGRHVKLVAIDIQLAELLERFLEEATGQRPAPRPVAPTAPLARVSCYYCAAELGAERQQCGGCGKPVEGRYLVEEVPAGETRKAS